MQLLCKKPRCPLLLGWALVVAGSHPALAQTVVPPEPVEQPPALWPGGKPHEHDALVPLAITVQPDGSVSDVEVEASMGPELDAAARENVLRWHFRPATRDGVAVPARIRVVVRFHGVPMPEPAPPAAPSPVGPAPTPPPATEGPAALSSPPARVTVEGRRPQRHAAAGDYTLRPGALRDVPRRRGEDLLTLAPGFRLSNHGGALHPSGIFLRGFDAEEGQDLEISVQGVPVNQVSNAHGHGYADTHFVLPELVSELRVVEGPFDPRQGDFAVAGSVEYRLGLEERGIVTQLGVGSFGARRVLALWGPAGESEGTFAGVAFERGDGFGPNRAYSSANAVGQWEWPLGERTTLGVFAQTYAGRYDSAGVVREDDVTARRLSRCAPEREAQLICLYDPNQGGAASRTSVSARLESKGRHVAHSLSLFAVRTSLSLRENFTGYLEDAAGGQRGDGVQKLHQATTVGSRGSTTLGADWRGARQELELGWFARHDDASPRQWRLRTQGGEPYRVDFDGRVRVVNVAGYLAGKLAPWWFLVLRGGLRVDAFSFSHLDRNRPPRNFNESRLTEAAVEAYGLAWQPRASVEARASRWLSWITSYGVGTRSSDAQALSSGESAPFARVTAVETGLVAHRDEPREPSGEARLVAFATHVDRDLLFDESAGRNVLAGASRRYGWVASAAARSSLGLDGSASLTHAEAHLHPREAGTFALGVGERLPYVPRWVARLDASARRPFEALGEPLRWGIATGASWVAAPPLPFERFGTPYATVDVAGRLGWRGLELALEVTNLLDRRNRATELHYASNFRGPDQPAPRLPAVHFASAAPRTLFATLTWHLAPPDDERPE